MPALPGPVVAAIVRGMSAYMQVARPLDLPVRLRPLQGKHIRMLNAQRDAIVSALDDDGLRAMILDWLDDKPSGISKPDAAILSAAARRDDGWAEILSGSQGDGSEVPKRDQRDHASRDRSEELRREKDRARKAREDAKKVKEDAARAVADEKRAGERLRAEVAELTATLRALRGELSVALKERDAAVREMEREVRKARRRAEKAETDAGAAKAEARAAKAEAVPAQPVRRPAKTPARPKPRAAPARRQRLPVPKGRLAEAPETLTEWLSTPEVRLLVDGYNVSLAPAGFGDLDLEAQRARLLQEVGKVARRHQVPATVIFDGSAIAPGIARRPRGPVEVEYSRPDEIADDHLIAKLEGLPKHPVIVVTNDRELQNRAARLGATIATSDQLLGLIR